MQPEVEEEAVVALVALVDFLEAEGAEGAVDSSAD